MRLAGLKSIIALAYVMVFSSCAPGQNANTEEGQALRYDSPALEWNPGKDIAEFKAWSANLSDADLTTKINGFVNSIPRRPSLTSSLGQKDACIPSYKDTTHGFDVRKQHYKLGPSSDELARAIVLASQQFDIDALALAALMAHESQYCPWGVSFSGAVGLSQFTGAGIAEVHWQLGVPPPASSGIKPVPAAVVESTTKRFNSALKALGVEAGCNLGGNQPCASFMTWIADGNVNPLLKQRIQTLEKNFAVYKGKQYKILPVQYKIFSDYRLQVVYAATLLRRNLLINQQDFCAKNKISPCDKGLNLNQLSAIYMGAWEQYNGSPSDQERKAYPNHVKTALNALISLNPG